MSNPKVTLETNQGNIILELYPEQAPKTVDNFLQYVDSGFYENTLFHRVIKGFMIQGGGFDEAMQRKTTLAPVENEADNGLDNARGTVAMARTNEPLALIFVIDIIYFQDYFIGAKKLYGIRSFKKNTGPIKG